MSFFSKLSPFSQIDASTFVFAQLFSGFCSAVRAAKSKNGAKHSTYNQEMVSSPASRISLTFEAGDSCLSCTRTRPPREERLKWSSSRSSCPWLPALVPESLHPTPQPRNLAPNQFHSTPHTLHPTPVTLRPTPRTPHPIAFTLQPTPYTTNPTPHTLDPRPYTRSPELQSLTRS